MPLTYVLLAIAVIVGIILLFQFGPSLVWGLKNPRLGKESRLKLCKVIELDKVTEVYIIRFRKNRGMTPSERLENVLEVEYEKAGLAHAERHDMYDLSKNHALQRGFVSMTLSSRISPHEVLSIHVGPKSSEVESVDRLHSLDKYHYLVAIKVGCVTEDSTSKILHEKNSAGTVA